MSTHANIGILEPNGKIKAIYCHNDGYIEHIGPLLINHYNSREKVKELISLGNISVLAERIKPESWENHSFDNRLPDVTVAYHRDRKESYSDNEATIYASKSDYIDHADASFLYLFDINDDTWKVAEYSYKKRVKFYSLTSKLKEKTKTDED